jgi:hypothetical protein
MSTHLPLVWILFHSPPLSRQLEHARTLFKLAGQLQSRPLFVGTTPDNTVSINKCNVTFNAHTHFIDASHTILVYLDIPSSALTPSNVQLMFVFGAGTATRSWNIKIAMLPCGASYLGKQVFILTSN